MSCPCSPRSPPLLRFPCGPVRGGVDLCGRKAKHHFELLNERPGNEKLGGDASLPTRPKPTPDPLTGPQCTLPSASRSCWGTPRTLDCTATETPEVSPTFRQNNPSQGLAVPLVPRQERKVFKWRALLHSGCRLCWVC